MSNLKDYQIIQSVTVDLVHPSAPQLVMVKQYDNAVRVLQVNLVANGLSYEIPESFAVRLRGTRPDGKGIMSDALVTEGNTAWFEITNAMTACAGRIPCDVELSNADGAVVKTASMWLDVKWSPLQDGTVEASETFSALEAALAKVQKIPATAGYSMMTIASGTYTPVNEEDETATSTNIEFEFDGATLDEIRKYKAIFVQVSGAGKLNGTGNVSINFWRHTANSNSRTTVAYFRYGLQSHRAILLFADAEHYAAMVLAVSDSNDMTGKTYATTEAATNKIGIGIVDLSAVPSDSVLSLKSANATIGNEITYQVVGISEEAANFT